MIAKDSDNNQITITFDELEFSVMSRQRSKMLEDGLEPRAFVLSPVLGLRVFGLPVYLDSTLPPGTIAIMSQPQLHDYLLRRAFRAFQAEDQP